MTRIEAVNAYIERFGYFPFMFMRGVPDEVVIELIQKALDTGEEIVIHTEENSDY